MTPTIEEMPMMRPQRCFIMPRSTARVEMEGGGEIDRDDLVPLFILHAHEEIVAGHAGIVDEDIHTAHDGFASGTRGCRRRPSWRGCTAGSGIPCRSAWAVSSRAPTRVSESATVAPARLSASAISRPMPPLAPVTKARLPVKSNMLIFLGSSGDGRDEGVMIGGSADGMGR